MKLFGWLGMFFVQASTLLQILCFYRNKKTIGVSVGFWWVVYIGLMCYLVYSISIMDWVYITSNCVGIVLSSISIIMYYYYRKVEEKNGRNVDSGDILYTPSMGRNESIRPNTGNNSQTVGVFREVPLRKHSSSEGGRKSNQVLCQVQKVQIVNICIDCHRFWVNNQGYPRYINLEEAGEMIMDKATKRFQYCPSCKEE